MFEKLHLYGQRLKRRSHRDKGSRAFHWGYRQTQASAALGRHAGNSRRPRTASAASDYGRLGRLPSFPTMKHVLKTNQTPGKDNFATSVTSPGPKPQGPTRKAHRQQACAPPHRTNSLKSKARYGIEEPANFNAIAHDFFLEPETLLSPALRKPATLLNTYSQPWERQALGVLAREVLPHPRGARAAEGRPCPASPHPPEQRPEPAVCRGCPGRAPRNCPPVGPRASHARPGGRAYPRANSGETERTGTSGRTGMPRTAACPGSASACGSPRAPGDLRRGRLVPGSRREGDRSAEAGHSRHRVSRTVGGRKCR